MTPRRVDTRSFQTHPPPVNQDHPEQRWQTRRARTTERYVFLELHMRTTPSSLPCLQRLKSALWYAVGQMVDEEVMRRNRNATPQFIGALTEMVWLQIGTRTPSPSPKDLTPRSCSSGQGPG